MGCGQDLMQGQADKIDRAGNGKAAPWPNICLFYKTKSL